jgi:hypothetical protein
MDGGVVSVFTALGFSHFPDRALYEMRARKRAGRKTRSIFRMRLKNVLFSFIIYYLLISPRDRAKG